MDRIKYWYFGIVIDFAIAPLLHFVRYAKLNFAGC